jgi:hypothetical protein
VRKTNRLMLFRAPLSPRVTQLLDNFLSFYGPDVSFTRAFHWSLLSAWSIQSIPLHPIYLRSTLILITPTSVFLVVFLLLVFSHTCYMPCPAHPPWLDRSNYIWRRVQFMMLIVKCYPSILWFKYSPHQLVLRYLRSKCFCLNVRDQVSNSYETTRKIIVM